MRPRDSGTPNISLVLVIPLLRFLQKKQEI